MMPDMNKKIWVDMGHSKVVFHLWSLFTTSKTDCQLFCQKIRHRISVMKTNTGVFVVFKRNRELKHQFSGNIKFVCFHYWDSLTNFLTE